MSQVRKDVRGWAVARLLGQTVAGSRVHNSRQTPLNDGALDALNVYVDSDTVEILDEAPRRYRRKATMVIEGVCYGSNCAARADDLSHQVEQLLFVDETAGGLVEQLDLVDVKAALNAKGDKELAAFVQRWSFTYYSEAPVNQAAALSALREINARWNLPPLGDPDSATDQILPPQ